MPSRHYNNDHPDYTSPDQTSLTETVISYHLGQQLSGQVMDGLSQNAQGGQDEDHTQDHTCTDEEGKARKREREREERERECLVISNKISPYKMLDHRETLHSGII